MHVYIGDWMLKVRKMTYLFAEYTLSICIIQTEEPDKLASIYEDIIQARLE